MRFMIIVKATKDSEAGVMPGAAHCPNGKVPRGATESGRAARCLGYTNIVLSA